MVWPAYAWRWQQLTTDKHLALVIISMLLSLLSNACHPSLRCPSSQPISPTSKTPNPSSAPPKRVEHQTRNQKEQDPKTAAAAANAHKIKPTKFVAHKYFRMEDPSKKEWEAGDYATTYESNEKLGWIWRKGLNLGKKMVVACAVIASAPLVLPPLVALSTVGFVFSVPVGFAFVTSACTEKAVNSLLPLPSSRLLLEKGVMSREEEADWVNRNDAAKWYGEDQKEKNLGRIEERKLGRRVNWGMVMIKLTITV